jgi:hypothetical protein
MAMQYGIKTGWHYGQSVVVGVLAMLFDPLVRGGMGIVEAVEKPLEYGRSDRQKGTGNPIEQFVGVEHLDSVACGDPGQGQFIKREAVAKCIGGKGWNCHAIF